MDDLSMVSSKKRKRKHKQTDGDEDYIQNMDIASSTMHDADRNGGDHKKKKKKKKDKSLTEFDSQQSKKKKKKKKNDIDLTLDESLTEFDSQQSKKKNKKDKNHIDLTLNESLTEFDSQQSKKKKKKKKNDIDLTLDESLTEFDSQQSKKKKKKKKKKKRHSNEADCFSDIDSVTEHQEEHSDLARVKSSNGISNAFGSKEGPASESANETGGDTDGMIVSGVSDNETGGDTDGMIVSGVSDNESTLVDQDSVTGKSSSKSSEEKKRSRRDLLTALTLTDEESAIVHNGKSTSSPNHIENLQREGISIRVGKWIPPEDEILVQNFERLKNESLIDIDNSFLLQLLFTHFMACTKEERRRVKTYLKESHFHIRLAGNLRRLPESVLDRARKILPTWKTGPFTAREEQHLLNLHQLHGKQWTLIGYHLNRSRNSVLDHYRIIKDAHRKKGIWTEDESNALLGVISEVMDTEDLLSLPHFKLPWKQIEKRMQHRNGKQCRSHWVYQLRPLLIQGGSRVKQVDKNLLLRELCSLDIETESEIDWVELLEKMPEAGTPQQLMQQWQHLKSCIAGVDRMTFDEIRDVLSGSSLTGS